MNGYIMDGNRDKMQGKLDQRAETWGMKCIYCQSKKLAIHPLGIAYRPFEIRSHDDLPLPARTYYKNLPNIVEAIMKCLENDRTTTILVECVDCKTVVRGFWNGIPTFGDTPSIRVDKTALRNYVSEFYGYNEDDYFLAKLKA